MKAKVQKIFEVNQPIATVWEYLKQPTIVIPCLPGATLTHKVNDRNYKWRLQLQATKFNGDIEVTQKDTTNRKFDWSGSGEAPRAAGRAEVVMNTALKLKDNRSTEIVCELEIDINGTNISNLDELVNQLLEGFVNNLKEKIKSGRPRTVEVPPWQKGGRNDDIDDNDATSTVEVPPWQVSSSTGFFGSIIKMLKRLFRRK